MIHVATARQDLSLSEIERILPHDIEVERAVLGAILFNNNVWEHVDRQLKGYEFYEKRHQLIYDAITKILNLSRSVDPISLAIYLKDNDAFGTEENGKAYLLGLVNEVDYGRDVVEYSRLIHDLYLRRCLIEISEQTIQKAMHYENYEKAPDVVEETEQNLFKLVEGDSRTREREFGKVATEALKHVERACKNDSHLSGLTTGLTDLDKNLSGLQKSDLIILASRPGMGKTALAGTIAFNAASHLSLNPDPDAGNQVPCVAFFSLEMSAEQLALRTLASVKKISVSEMLHGKLKSDDLAGLQAMHKSLQSLPLYFDDSALLSIPLLRARARRLKRKRGLGLIVVDYLQLLDASSAARRDGRVSEVSEISRGLKAVAKELDVPVLALSQLSRQVEGRQGRKPQLSDLRDSGTIEQDADIVLLLYREEYYLNLNRKHEGEDGHENWLTKKAEYKNIAELSIAKHRNGPTGSLRLHFDDEYTLFRDLAKQSPNEVNF